MKKAFMFLMAFTLFAINMSGQGEFRRKRVAVVLSGGGAKGMAHIGVLRVLERAGIPVDIITGTSMGSIIGGLYACGYNSSELDSIVRVQDWSYILSDREDLSHQTLAEREDQNTYMMSRSINFKSRSTSGGGGFIMGKNINDIFGKLTYPYNDSIDFNQLPIPFACVSTNIIDNTEHVFHSGILSESMRASMAIPGVFSPVRKGDKVLVDGGLRNNYPADIAREMGADIIIGVGVQGKPKTADDLGSATAILSQIVDVNCKNKYEDNVALSDLFIRVNTNGYSAASFSAAAIDTLIRRGEEAAMEHWDEILDLYNRIGDLSSEGPRPSRAEVEDHTKTYRIGELRYDNLSSQDEHYLRSKYRIHVGDSIDRSRADLITTTMRQDLFFQTASYRIEPNTVECDDGTMGARVIFVGGEKRRNQVNVGARFDNEEIVALQANASFPLHTHVPTELDFTVRLGKRIMSSVNIDCHPRSFIHQSSTFEFRHNDINIYEYGKKSFNITYNRYALTLIPINFNIRNFNIRIGAAWNYYHYRNLLVDKLPEHQIIQPENQHLFNYIGQVDYNSENNWYFPTRGARLHARFVYYTDNFAGIDGDAGTREYSASWRKSFPVNSVLSIQPMIYGRLLSGDHTPFIIQNKIGGEWFSHYLEEQMPFAGIGYIEQAWDKLIAAQIQGQLNLTENNIVLVRFAAGQDANKMKDLFDHKTMFGGSVSYYYNSMFGPVGATVGYSSVTEKPMFYVNLGFVF